jgi:hypothetical protein
MERAKVGLRNDETAKTDGKTDGRIGSDFFKEKFEVENF